MDDPWSERGVVETYTGGQCRQFYSVACHTLHVSRELPGDPRFRLLGLFHDAGGAYVGDVPRPLKAEYDAFERVEERVLSAVWAGLGVEPPDDDE
jgi:5'-deoxynucleotidase YfbR-like HD superfamily hydrolase